MINFAEENLFPYPWLVLQIPSENELRPQKQLQKNSQKVIGAGRDSHYGDDSGQYSLP